MRAKLTLEAEDESEFEQLGDVLDSLGIDGVEFESDEEPEPPRTGNSGDDKAPISDDELQAVYNTIKRDQGRSRGKYHEALVEDDRIWYDDPDDEDYEEREDLGEKMWDLERRGYLRHEGRRWYPA